MGIYSDTMEVHLRIDILSQADHTRSCISLLFKRKRVKTANEKRKWIIKIRLMQHNKWY